MLKYGESQTFGLLIAAFDPMNLFKGCISNQLMATDNPVSPLFHPIIAMLYELHHFSCIKIETQ